MLRSKDSNCSVIAYVRACKVFGLFAASSNVHKVKKELRIKHGDVGLKSHRHRHMLLRVSDNVFVSSVVRLASPRVMMR